MTLRYVNLSAEDIRDEFLAALHRRDRQQSLGRRPALPRYPGTYIAP
jgi:hypothetical protein